VLARGDALNVYTILSKGSSAKAHLQSVCLDLFAFCSEHRIELRPKWLPREENERADYLSKVRDVDDFGLSADTFALVSRRFGPFTVDKFASELNTKLPRFNAFYWCPGAAAANCFTQDWGGDERKNCSPPPSFTTIPLLEVSWGRAPSDHKHCLNFQYRSSVPAYLPIHRNRRFHAEKCRKWTFGENEGDSRRRRKEGAFFKFQTESQVAGGPKIDV
jgi:hypothetical protein